MALYELRIYECVPGRLSALHSRFRNHTTKLFKKHGVDVVGYWTDKWGESNKLTYLVKWQNEAERDTKWAAFASDPDWQKARSDSELPENGGTIVARVLNPLMEPTDYSDMK